MPVLRVVILWHQHQPFYKDLVSGEYRMPWVRLHALKDYYGMVKLLDEFPQVHQTFNLVPSLITQIQDYAAGNAHDPFLAIAAKPAVDLTLDNRRFALKYLFQANPANMIGRYPRYGELFERFRSAGSAERAEGQFQAQDFTDLQVLSQIAWHDEFFLGEPGIADLIAKQRNYSLADQQTVVAREREFIAKVLPVHAEAAKRGSIEISTSPFYHPILPLVCDTDLGEASAPGLPLPQNRFRQPGDAKEQLRRGLDLHEEVFGLRPVGVWPSEGSLSEEVLAIAHSLGVGWMATDEGVLGRSLGVSFSRDESGRLPAHLAERLYTIYRYQNAATKMHLIFRDHAISDLIGFVYSGMPPQEAAGHLLRNIQQAVQPILNKGRDAVVPIILDGENAWEYFPQSGREFLRRFYSLLQSEPGIEAVTVSEAIARHRDFASLTSLVPGSWINSNFNVWIGAPEDNLAWDYLYQARDFYQRNSAACTEAQRNLAFEELLIAEGSDWNWWYGPEHHSANDHDFDDLYRKHLANVYQALGAVPPDYLFQPIAVGAISSPRYLPQTAYIHPRITGDSVRYFDWIGAAHHVADARSGAMHGKVFLLDAIYAGIDAANLYGRLDFAATFAENDCQLVVNVEASAEGSTTPTCVARLEAKFAGGNIESWGLNIADGEYLSATSDRAKSGVEVAFRRSFEFRLPFAILRSPTGKGKLRLRFSLWQNRLPIDALPVEGWLELHLVSEEELLSLDS